MAILATTDDLSGPVRESPGTFVKLIEAELDGLFRFEKTPTIHMRSAEPPSWVQLLADVAEWITPFKVAATVFLSQLAKNAADDLWKNKAAIAAVLHDSAFATLLTLSSALASAKRRARPRTDILVGLPIPDDYFGTTLIVPADSVEDAAITLSVFISRVEEISAVIRAAVAAGEGPAAGARVLIRPNGGVVLRWQHQTTLELIEREIL